MFGPEEGIRAAVGAKVANSMDALMSQALRPLISRAATSRAPGGRRRFCVLHLDGVSRETLLRAMRRGYAPFLGRLLLSGSYRLSPCWSGAPASTPAYQAGLLYGIRDSDIPGFFWYDRDQQREVRMDRAEDAAAVEARLAQRAQGLLRDGTTHFSVFTGGAEVNGFSMAGWAKTPRILSVGMDAWHFAAATLAHSFTAARIVGRLAKEGFAALYDLFRQSALVGRLQHEPTFFLHRVGLAIGAREAATWLTITDIARGVPAIYTCFGDYDEIAHRRGPESKLAMLAIWGIDRAVARIFAAANAVPEMGYDFYVVADHGQVTTRPFEAATGLGLLDYLAMALPDGDGAPRVPDEVARGLNRLRLAERAASVLPDPMKNRARRAVLEAARAIAHRRNQSDSLRVLDEVLCVDAGDISHIYLGRERRQLTVEEIERRYPRLLEVLTRCPAVGIVAGRGGRQGWAWIRGRRVDLADPGDVAQLAIGYGGRMVAEFLAKMLRIRSAGDLIAYGNGVPGGDVAFAWEFGSHAGVAREEVETFVIHPARIGYDFTAIQHGADLHDYLVEHYPRADQDAAVAAHPLH